MTIQLIQRNPDRHARFTRSIHSTTHLLEHSTKETRLLFLHLFRDITNGICNTIHIPWRDARDANHTIIRTVDMMLLLHEEQFVLGHSRACKHSNLISMTAVPIVAALSSNVVLIAHYYECVQPIALHWSTKSWVNIASDNTVDTIQAPWRGGFELCCRSVSVRYGSKVEKYMMLTNVPSDELPISFVIPVVRLHWDCLDRAPTDSDLRPVDRKSIPYRFKNRPVPCYNRNHL